MKIKLLTLFIFNCLLLIVINNLKASTIEPEKNDTIEAVVLYGNRFLFDPNTVKSKNQIIQLRDSLLMLNGKQDERVNGINFFLSIGKYTKRQLHFLIDSLFTTEKVPFALINQISHYAATNDVFLKTKDVELPYFYGNMHYPAIQLYGDWQTKHTYRSENKIGLDRSLECTLTDSFNFCGFSKAVNGQVSSNFGFREKRMHFGIDFSCKHGDSIFSVFDGVVRFAGRDGGFGNVVVVRHYNGLETLYAHLSKISVNPGDEVHYGQMLGKAGNTGKSHGTHLHFEIRLLGKAIDPNHILNVHTWKLHDNEVVINEGINHLHAYPKMAKYHVVRKGELLYQIAERYGMSVKQICELNHLGKRKTIYLGQKLRIG